MRHGKILTGKTSLAGLVTYTCFCGFPYLSFSFMETVFSKSQGILKVLPSFDRRFFNRIISVPKEIHTYPGNKEGNTSSCKWPLILKY